MAALLCGCADIPAPSGTVDAVLEGVVVKGPVDGAAVTLHVLQPDGTLGPELATATTEADGRFVLHGGNAHGHLVVRARGGRYREEAPGTQVTLEAELLALVDRLVPNEKRAGLAVTPVTTLAAVLAQADAAAGAGLEAAMDAAQRDVDAHFLDGLGDSRYVVPADWTADGAVLDLSPAATHGLVIAGMSAQAAFLATRDGVQPGTTLNVGRFVHLLARDLGDGRFDGLRSDEALAFGRNTLDPFTARSGLALGIVRFLQSAGNGSPLGPDDVAGFLEALSGRESRLFPGAGSALDREGPRITFEAPGELVQGPEVALSVLVEDEAGSALEEVTVAPLAGLTGAAWSADGVASRARLTATLDSLRHPDGPLTLEVTARDAFGNARTERLAVLVANTPPSIEVVLPPTVGTVQGRVSVQARATAPAGRALTAFTVRPGAGAALADVDGAVDGLTAEWDTAAGPEGPVSLVFEAVDDAGISGRRELAFVVDNREPARVEGWVSLGTPVSGLDVLAHPLRADGVRGAAVGGPARTGQDGRFELTLLDENYAGPVELATRLPSDVPASYVDPVSGQPVILASGQELAGVVPELVPGAVHASAVIDAWTTLGVALARRLGQTGEPEPVAAAAALLAGHWRPEAAGELFPLWTTVPAAPSQVGLHDAGVAGLAELSLHLLAERLRAEATQGPLTPASLPGVAVLRQLAIDLGSDGVFDGENAGAALQLSSAGYALGPDTTRRELALVLHAFVRSEENTSGLGAPDVFPTLEHVTQDRSRIYPPDAETIPFDQAPPTIAVAPEDLDGAVLGPEDVQVTATAYDDSGIKSLALVSPALEALGSGPDGLTVRVGPEVVPEAGDDRVRLLFRAQDNAGRLAEREVAFGRRAPAIEWLEPAVDAWSRSPVAIEGRVESGYALASFELRDPDGQRVGDDDAEAHRVQASVALADGAWTLELAAADVAGNVVRAPRLLRVDSTGPVVQVETPAVGETTYTNATTVPVRAWVADAGVGTQRVEILVGGAVVQQLEVPACGNGCQVEGQIAAPTSAGLHVQVRAIDALGNATLTGTAQLMVDHDPPAVHADVLGLRTTFLDERSLTPVWNGTAFDYVAGPDTVAIDTSEAFGASAETAPSWPKYEVRLSGTTEAANANSAGNVPLVFVRVDDEDATSSTPLNRLRVEYRYFHNGVPQLSWTTAYASAESPSPGIHYVPVSTEALGPVVAADAERRLGELQVRVTDLAGNATTVSFRFRIQLLPAPLAVTVDATYAQSGDPLGAHAHTFANDGVDELFEAAEWGTAGIVRLARLVVENPHPVPVALTPAAPGGYVRFQRVRAHGTVDQAARTFPCAFAGTYCDTLRTAYAPCREGWGSPTLPGDRLEEYQWLPAGERLRPGRPTLDTPSCELFSALEAALPAAVPSVSGDQQGVLPRYALARVTSGQEDPATYVAGTRFVLGPGTVHHLYVGVAPIPGVTFSGLLGLSGRSVYGRHLFDLDLFDGFLDPVPYNTYSPLHDLCRAAGSCYGDRNRIVHFVQYEAALSLTGIPPSGPTGTLRLSLSLASVRDGDAQANTWSTSVPAVPVAFLAEEGDARPWARPVP